MSASVSLSRRAGFTLLEMIVAVALLTVVLAIFFSTWNESTQMGTILTVQAELRAKAQVALNRIVNDMRSTQTGAGAVSMVPADTNATMTALGLPNLTANAECVSFYPIYTTTTTPSASGSCAVFWTTSRTVYSWDPAQTTVPNANWNLSTIKLTTYDVATLKQSPQFALVTEVTGFSIVPYPDNGQLNGFSSTQPQTFLVTLQLSRQGVYGKGSGVTGQAPADQPYIHSNGAVTVTVTTNVTIPPG